MTARQIYEYALIELNKVEAPSLLLEDFNYLFNKAIYQFINKVYNIYDLNQQTSDSLRVLKSTAVLKPTKVTDSSSKLYGNFYEAELPSDYYHILNCICEFVPTKNFKCYDAGSPVYFAARRLTSDMWSQVINNFYMRPMYKRPYYFIHNTNTSNTLPTNPYIPGTQGSGLGTGTDMNGVYSDTNPNLSKTILVNGKSQSVVEVTSGNRFGNASTVRVEIRYGKDDSLFKLNEVHVDYLKTPQYIRITQDQLDLTEDTSQILEYPDYVCYEIINELVKLLLENASDPRLQSNPIVNQSIASPVPMDEPQK